jgi:uncharacterized protein YjiS (DUF1127 family)
MSYQTWFVSHSRVSGTPPWPAITNAVLQRWLAALRRMHERWNQRKDLRELDDHLLRDIGITREQARREIGKPFWR